MKYAILKNFFVEDTKEAISINIGDNLQIMAIKGLYNHLGLKFDELIKIGFNELQTYDGEECLLPYNGSLFNKGFLNGNLLKISPKIMPIFLGVHLGAGFHEGLLNEQNISFLKKYSPIGCRDYYTKKRLDAVGIKTWLNGCMTLTINEERKEKLGEKIIGIDVPIEIKDYMPNYISDSIIFRSQQAYFDSGTSYQIIDQYAYDQYKYIYDNAKLVITSRLHVAVPCLALGIPVIVTKREIDSRFDWIDKLIPLYSKTDFDRIEWNTCPIDCSSIQYDMLQNAIQILSKLKCGEYVTNVRNVLVPPSNKYPAFHKVILGLEQIDLFLEKHKSGDYKWKYDLWGTGEKANTIYLYMKEKYSRFTLENVIDKHSKVIVAGKVPIRPDDYSYNSNIVIVSGVKASSEARQRLLYKLERVVFIADIFLT